MRFFLAAQRTHDRWTLHVNAISGDGLGNEIIRGPYVQINGAVSDSQSVGTIFNSQFGDHHRVMTRYCSWSLIGVDFARKPDNEQVAQGSEQPHHYTPAFRSDRSLDSRDLYGLPNFPDRSHLQSLALRSLSFALQILCSQIFYCSDLVAIKSICRMRRIRYHVK